MLKLRGKELSPNQMKVVCDAENTRNPLFLKIVIEVCRMFIYGKAVFDLENNNRIINRFNNVFNQHLSVYKMVSVF